LHEREASGATPAEGTVPVVVIRVQRPHHNSGKLLTKSQFHLHRHSEISSVANTNTVNLGIKTVYVFPKNATVSDMTFRELGNFKKSYDCGVMLLVYMEDIICTQVIASTVSNSSLQHLYHELMLHISECP
jgi:hypothetical protein